MSERVVMHVDMDAFYAAVEARERPELRGVPLVVGGRGRRGVVMTCSYEARRYGVRSAMPSVTAERLCPDAVWVSPRMRLYREVSARVFETLEAEIPVIEKVSVDEAYGELTGLARDVEDAREIGLRIKAAVRENERLTASLGIAPNRFVAKIASDLEKPDGFVSVPPSDVVTFLAPLSVRVVPGVGPKLAERLARLGLKTIADIAASPEGALERALGERPARYLRDRSVGRDETPVRTGSTRRQVSEERTYRVDLIDRERIETELFARAEGVGATLRGGGFLARRVTVKIRDAAFRTATRSVTLEEPTDLAGEIFDAACRLLRDHLSTHRGGVRLLGVAASELVKPSEVQRGLFPDPEREKMRKIERTGDELRRRFGEGAARRGRLVDPPSVESDRPTPHDE